MKIEEATRYAQEEQDYDPAILDERNPFTPPESEAEHAALEKTGNLDDPPGKRRAGPRKRQRYLT